MKDKQQTEWESLPESLQSALTNLVEVWQAESEGLASDEELADAIAIVVECVPMFAGQESEVQS